MNDDQIRSELERRAGSAASAPDWTKRALLPAVWHEVDARPQPVVTSRWPSLAGATALVAALLILVVAVPRLAPQLPSSTSSPIGTPRAEPTSPPPILTTAEFASRLTAGDLAGRTVLVDGSIAISVRRGPLCVPYDPPHHCFLGTLGEVDPAIDIWARTFPTTESDSTATWTGADIWPWWTGPGAVSGILVLSVADNGQVDFIGPVRESGSGLSWTVAEATELALASVEPQEVILINGWLGGYAYARCLADPLPRIEGLPNRQCSYERIISEAEVVVEGPRPPAVQVQRGAYSEFAENPAIQGNGDNSPREGLYAIAPRLEGWCDGDEPPCWRWSVVARVDSAPTPQPTPVPTPAPTPAARTISCQASEALGDPGIALIDHSGQVSGCFVAEAQSVVDAGPFELTSTDQPARLAATWAVNLYCPSDDQLEFWGPLDEPVGGADYVMQLMRVRSQTLEVPGDACDVVTFRTVEIEFTDPISPRDILGLAVDKSIADNTVSASSSEGSFQLKLSAPAVSPANQPIDVTSS